MTQRQDHQFWFVTGSQDLYGEATLAQVEQNSGIIVRSLNEGGRLPCPVLPKGVMKTPEEIRRLLTEANSDPACAGVITFMHTFSPSKMWIAGLSALQKPYLHFHTQFNRRIPNDAIDMDYMNLHQAAHGDREHGFIGARLRSRRKIVAGHYEDEDAQHSIALWMRAALGAAISKNLKIMRFGDNMREVAVTEGDKVEAQLKLGWQVNTWGVGALAEAINAISDADVQRQMSVYNERYTFTMQDTASIAYQARCELAMRHFLTSEGCGAFTNTFQDLYGMNQLPGLATQNLMADGYGYGGEGDWKVAALTHILKRMSDGLPGGTSFMEDYTYDLTPGKELSLGAHMLEVCPSIAADRPRIEVHPLGIGGKEPPARLVFEGAAGPAIAVSLVDMGGRLRMIVQCLQCVKPILDMPKLPVARVMWKPLPDLKRSAEMWILAGGAHHTVLSYAVTAEMMRDFARIMDIEFVLIDEQSRFDAMEQQLLLSDLVWKLK